MNTDNIKIVFENYLKAGKTQYAILINGAWGSGKTFFWNNSLQQIVKRNDFTPIYISLNGISKIETLNHLLFIKLIPFINKQENPVVKSITTLLTNIANLASKKVLDITLTEVFKDVSIESFAFSKHIICFDDLERCQIPVREVLGFINNYVEHKSLKTLILADETKIDFQEKEYDGIKEKVIGRVLNFKPNVQEALPQLFQKYKESNTPFYDFLLSKTQILTDLFNEYNQDNLRIISFYLDILSNLYPCLKGVEEQYIQEIIFFTALITFEFKNGILKSSEYNNPKGLDSIDDLYFIYNWSEKNSELKNGKSSSEKNYAEKFYEKYIKDKNKNYVYYPSIFSYILSGYIDLTQFKEEIVSKYPKTISQEEQDFRNLLTPEFRSLDDSEFDRLISSVLQFAEEGKYSIYEYVSIARFFYFFSNEKLITQSDEEITSKLIEGLSIAKSKKQINNNTMDTILHFGSENEKVSNIEMRVKVIHDQLKKEQNVDNNKELIDCLFTNDNPLLEALYQKYELSKELFQCIDSKDIFEKIINVSNPQISNFIQRLERRYNSSNIGVFLYEDTECLKTLHDSLKEYLATNQNMMKLRTFLIQSLINTLDEKCKHLEKTKNK